MGGSVNLWRLAPALYYRMVQEVVRRSVGRPTDPQRGVTSMPNWCQQLNSLQNHKCSKTCIGFLLSKNHP